MRSDVRNIVSIKVFPVLTCIMLMAGCATFETQSNPEPVAEIGPGILQGYLATEMLPNSLELIPPPAEGSTSLALDGAVSKTSLALRRTLADAALATDTAKNNYKRTRPFAVNKEPTCTPEDEIHLRKDGSYPSGHTAIGWAWALILSEVAPEQTDAILARGPAFGQSRVICNVHWQSDVTYHFSKRVT